MQSLQSLFHGLDFLLSFILWGFVIFCVGILPAGKSAAQTLMRDWPRKFRRLTLWALLSSVIWLFITCLEMAGGFHPGALQMALLKTQFGPLWLVKIGVLILIWLLSKATEKHQPWPWMVMLLFLTAWIPFFSTLTGHATSAGSQKDLRIFYDQFHCLAVSLWTGGLWALHLWLTRRAAANTTLSPVTYLVVRRFSYVAIGATGFTFITGTALSLLSGISLKAPWTSEYGLWALLKLFLFCGALSIAGMNHLQLLKASPQGNEQDLVRRLISGVRLEALIILLIYLVAGFLTRSLPPL